MVSELLARAQCALLLALAAPGEPCPDPAEALVALAPIELETGSPLLAGRGAADWGPIEAPADLLVREGRAGPALLRRRLRVGETALHLDQEVEWSAQPPLASRTLRTIPFLRVPLDAVGEVFLPRRDGRGLRVDPARVLCASYALAGEPAAGNCIPLALPLLDLALTDGRRAALFTDPLATSSFLFRIEGGELRIEVGTNLPCHSVPCTGERRNLHLRVHDGGPEQALDAFFRSEGEPSTPAWTRDIALVHFDYLSDRGKGWQRDLETLAARIPRAERGRVAVALHGWYDLLGQYAFDPARGGLLDQWIALPRRDGGVRMSVALVRERLAQARALGFRTLLYFADGMVADSASPMGARTLHPLGKTGWNGPEVVGELLVQNPADPEVRGWFIAYLDALLAAFGDRIDGLVWDETFWVRPQAVAVHPARAWAAPAALTLTRELARRTRAHRADLAFLVSDNIGHDGTDAPPTAIFAHGTFQDAESNPWAWSFGLFPNWRKPLWSVNWGAVTRFEETRLGRLRYAAPVTLSNGWADDQGPSEMPAELLERAIALFRTPSSDVVRPAWLEEEPAAYLARPLPGEIVPSAWSLGKPDALRYVDLAGTGAQEAESESRLVVERPTRVLLRAGSHGPLRLWLDGRLLLETRDERRHASGSDVVAGVSLAPGEHRLRVAVRRAASGFGFSLRIEACRDEACAQTSSPAR